MGKNHVIAEKCEAAASRLREVVTAGMAIEAGVIAMDGKADEIACMAAVSAGLIGVMAADAIVALHRAHPERVQDWMTTVAKVVSANVAERTPGRRVRIQITIEEKP